MALEQALTLAQTLHLSPTLLQSMEILQMTTLELGEYLKDLALENPTLEEDSGETGGLSWEAFASQVPWAGSGPIPVGRGEGAEPAAETDAFSSLALHLTEQLERRKLQPKLLALCRYLAENLDPKGYLEPQDLEDLRCAGISEAMLEEAVAVLQSLDPAGVGARNVGECLVLQLQRLPGKHEVEEAICRDHLPLLAQGKERALATILGVRRERVRQAAAVIRSLEPDVGRGFPEVAETGYVRPDAWVAEIDGSLQVFVNQWELPNFHVSAYYAKLADIEPTGETAVYLRDKLRQARWVLQCVQRRQDTLRRCLEALVQSQRGFFVGEQTAPGPLLRWELADILEVHPSTVTRALRNKYLQCQQGLFSVDWFFARAMGDSGQSEQRAKVRLRQMVAQEDPRYPLSDQILTERLLSEGFQLARRTVTKYRQALGLPSSRQRRRAIK